MARPKTRAERKRTFATLKSPNMDSDSAFRGTKPLPDDFKELVVMPHPIRDKHRTPLRGGHPVPPEERHRFLPVAPHQGRQGPTSPLSRHLSAASALKRATHQERVEVIGRYAAVGRGASSERCWNYICLMYCQDAPMSAGDIAEAFPEHGGTSVSSYLSNLKKNGLIETAGESRNDKPGANGRTYLLTDETTSAISRLVAEIRRRHYGDADDSRPVSDAGRVRAAAAEAVHRPSRAGISAAAGVPAEGDD